MTILQKSKVRKDQSCSDGIETICHTFLLTHQDLSSRTYMFGLFLAGDNLKKENTCENSLKQYLKRIIIPGIRIYKDTLGQMPYRR